MTVVVVRSLFLAALVTDFVIIWLPHFFKAAQFHHHH